MRCWLRRWLRAPITRSTACAWKARRVRFKRRGCRLDSIENKRNDTGLRFVLQPPRRAPRLPAVAGRSPARAHRLERSGGQIWVGSSHQVRPPHPAPCSSPRAQGADAERTATSCNWRWQECLFTSPSILSETTPLVLDLDPQPSPVATSMESEPVAVLCRNLYPTTRRSAGCSDRWTSKGEQPIQITTMYRGASRNRASRRLRWKNSQRLRAHPTAQSCKRAQAGSPSQELAWEPGPPDREHG